MKKTFTLKSTKCKCLKGIIHVPPDKSISIRALLVSSICFGNSKIKNLLISDDVINTLESIKKLGIKVKKKTISSKYTVMEDILKTLNLV